VRVNASKFAVCNIASSLIFACHCNTQYRQLCDPAFPSKVPLISKQYE
jgi:hypothetical protein